MVIYIVVHGGVDVHSNECYHSAAFTHGIPSTFIKNKYFHIVCTSLLPRVYVRNMFTIYHYNDSTWNHNDGKFKK